jgi:hypothetical protein
MELLRHGALGVKDIELVGRGTIYVTDILGM